MKLAAVIFDWAGTMIDYGSLAPVIAMRELFAAEGVPLEDGEIRAGMGLAKIDHIRSVLEMEGVAARWRDAKGASPGDGDVKRLFDTLGPVMIAAAAARGTLVPGAADVFERLKDAGVPVGSTTGYTRPMMAPILEAAHAQGYRPDVVVCAGDTKVGRPSPLMIWKALVELGVYPASAVVKVDDAPVGIAEGKAAGCFTVGVSASGNAMGLDYDAYDALPDEDRARRVAEAADQLWAAGADAVIPSVADLPTLLRGRFSFLA